MRKGWAFLAVAAVLATAACGSDSTGPGGGGQPVQTNQVSVQNDFFTPPNIQVAVGTTVTWTWNSGGNDHNVTFADTASSTQGSGTFSRTFNTAGTFAFHCTLHSGMTGSVLVQ